MGERIVLGTTTVDLSSEDFSRGYQEGYLRFTTYYQGKPLTDADVYGFLARNIYDSMTTDRYRAGYIMGWSAALHGQGRPGPTVGSYANAQQQVQVQA